MPSNYKYYDVSEDGVVLNKEKCPNCDEAYLAEHADRKHCGKCGYTEID